MARLIMRRGPRPGKVYELSTEVITIGSGNRNDIVILDNDISREHCRLIRVMADYELEDLNSQRGTFVSGQRVKDGWVLQPGNFIELGENVTLEYERAEAQMELESISGEMHPVSTEAPDPNIHPALVMTIGPRVGEIYPLKDKIVRIGRDLSNQIVIQDPEISRFHVVLRWHEKSYQLEDQNSTNGTLLNGTKMQPDVPQTLHSNDVIQLATMVEFRYTWQPGDVRIEPSDRKQAVKPSTKDLVSKIDTDKLKLLRPTSSVNKRQTSRLGTGLAPGALVDHVFVAYARGEWEAIVAPMTMILQDAGINIWVDQYLAQGGDDWMLAVEQALSECWLLIVVISPDALDSRYVRLAYRYFYNRDKPIIPLLYVPTESLPIELSRVKPIPYDSTNRKKTFDDLIRAIHHHTRP